MKTMDALRTLFKGNTISEEEIQAAIDRSLEYHHKIRPPEAPNVSREYHIFISKYRMNHPAASFIEIHEACMKAHPEYWPRTLPQ